MPVRTKAEQLAALDELIAAIEANPNASTSIGGRSFSKHDLPGLYAERRSLEREADRVSSGRRYQRVVPL